MLRRGLCLLLLAVSCTAVQAQAPAPGQAPAVGPATSKPIAVIEPWARATPPGAKVGAAYLEIRAAAGADDKLIAASSPVAGVTELHTHIMDGNVARMRRIEALAVPGGGSVAMRPGGHHIMLMDLKGPLKAGEAVKLKLIFERAGEIEVDVKVRPIGDQGSGSGSGAHR